MGSSSRSFPVAALGGLLLVAGSQWAFAQGTVPAIVRGRVAIPRDSTEVAVPGVMVTVHRVGADSSGPLDSARSDARGRFAVHYRRIADDQAVYFAAAVFRGIAYFTPPLKPGDASGDDAAIMVFDTTSKPVRLTVQGHHIVVSGPRPDGSRKVFEVWEVSNDTAATLVGKDSLSPVWSAPITDKAADIVAGQGDVSSASIVRRGNRMLLVAPFGPGVKQWSYSYSLPASAFPLTIPLESQTQILEVLVEDQEANASGGGLVGTPAAVTNGRTFKRYQSQSVAAGANIRITMPATTATARSRLFLALSLALGLSMMGALFFALNRRSRGVPPPVTSLRPLSEDLLAAIARLDAERESGVQSPTYESERAALKARLAEALAAEGRTTLPRIDE